MAPAHPVEFRRRAIELARARTNTLAGKLAATQHHGQDLVTLLNRLNTSGIPTARKPAALAAWLLDQATLPPATAALAARAAQHSRTP